MRTLKALALVAALVVACDDPVGLVIPGDAGTAAEDTGAPVPPDAAVPPDAGPRPDTGPGADVGSPDTGAAEDVGLPDTGEGPDAGELPDAGEGLDAAEGLDASEPADADAPGLDAAQTPDTGPNLSAIGGPCTQPADCANADTCLGAADGWPAAGYCAQSGCDEADRLGSCPAGAYCWNVSTTTTPRPMCLDLCQTGGMDPCRAGFQCTKVGGSERFCFPL